MDTFNLDKAEVSVQSAKLQYAHLFDLGKDKILSFW